MKRFDDVTNTQQIYWAVVKEIENKLKTALMWKYREIDLVIPILYVVYNNLGLKKGETNWGHRNLAAFVRPEEKYFFLPDCSWQRASRYRVRHKLQDILKLISLLTSKKRNQGNLKALCWLNFDIFTYFIMPRSVQ